MGQREKQWWELTGGSDSFQPMGVSSDAFEPYRRSARHFRSFENTNVQDLWVRAECRCAMTPSILPKFSSALWGERSWKSTQEQICQLDTHPCHRGWELKEHFHLPTHEALFRIWIATSVCSESQLFWWLFICEWSTYKLLKFLKHTRGAPPTYTQGGLG